MILCLQTFTEGTPAHTVTGFHDDLLGWALMLLVLRRAASINSLYCPTAVKRPYLNINNASIKVNHLRWSWEALEALEPASGASSPGLWSWDLLLLFCPPSSLGQMSLRLTPPPS